MKFQGQVLGGLFLFLFLLIGCGRDKANLEVQLLYGTENSAVEEIFQTYGGLITARAIFSHEGLQPGVQEAYQVEPARAAPTRLTSTNGQIMTVTTFWHKATAAGFNPFEQNQVVIPNIPLNKKRFRMAIEFLLQYQEATTGSNQYFAVAYACYVGPDGELSEEALRAHLQRGLQLFAGRTCGRCPIVEAQHAETDMPGFTAGELQNQAPSRCP